MEHLTKQQIVLLTLLVSFVTSIATGIFTVTLMQQAPGGVTSTINRIVERTVEKVVPVETQKAQIVTNEVTTIIKEDDLVVEAVAANEKSLVRVYASTMGNADPAFMGYGIIVATGGILVTDRKVYAENASYSGEFFGGSTYPLEVVRLAEGEKVVFLKPIVPVGEHPAFDSVTLAASRDTRLGQAVISLEGRERTSVSRGIVTALYQKDTDRAASTTPSAREIIAIETNIPFRSDAWGSPLIDLSAELVGIYLGNDTQSGMRTYVPANTLRIGIASTTAVVLRAKGEAN